MKRTITAALLFSLSLVAHATDAPSADPIPATEATSAGIKFDQVESRGAMSLPAGTKSVPLYVDFQGSPKLTRQLSEQLEAMGWQVTDDRNATHSLTAKGELHVWGKGYGLGSSSRVTATLASFVEENKVPTRPKPSGLFGAFGSMRESFNSAVSGSPDGWCLSDQCRLVWQTAVITMTYRSANKDQRLDVSVRGSGDALNLDAVVAEAVRNSFSAIKASPDPVASTQTM